MLNSRIMDLDLDLLIPCHMAGWMSGYFLMMDDMSPDYGTPMVSQWKPDIMEVRNDDFYRAYSATGEVINAAYKSAIMHKVKTNGWNQPDHSRRGVMGR
jgi:hypothetical protein